MPNNTLAPITAEPWERSPNESTASYQAFVMYRDQGAKRSAGRVGKELGKSSTIIERWCTDNNWVARVAAWEAHCDARKREAMLRRVEKVGERHAAIAEQMLEALAKRLDDILPEELSVRDVAYWFDVAVKLERQALGMETATKVEITGKDGAPLEAYLGKLTDEQLYQLTKQTLAAYEKDAGSN